MTRDKRLARRAQVESRSAAERAFLVLHFAQRHGLTAEQAEVILTSTDFDGDRADALVERTSTSLGS